MSFYIYDITFLVIFSIVVGIFLWRKKHNLKREGILYLYRTQVGLKFIDHVGGKYKKTISVLAFLGVVTGYILMSSVVYLFYKLVYIYLFAPEIVREIKIPPLMPLIPYLPEAFNISFLPPFYFTYWIIAIAVIAIFHEFAHGIVARRYDVKILTTGFGFLGPFLAAFVEPDEKSMYKKTKYQQIAILSAGVFTNFILAIIFFLLLSAFFVTAYVPAGAIFNTYTIGEVPLSSIDSIGGKSITDHTREGILKAIADNNINDTLVLGSNGKSVTLTKVIAQNDSYFITIDKLKVQLEKKRDSILLYYDYPAINAGLQGAIIQIDDKQIIEYNDLSEVMKNYKPGDVVTITTKDSSDGKEEILEYPITLVPDPENPERAIIGIGFVDGGSGLLSTMTYFFTFSKKQATNYEPRFNVNLVLFIYNLIWWLGVINLSVAIMNMWPMGIFDGGRMFMLTVWGITGSEKFAQYAFKFVTYIILGALFLLMFGWFIAVF